MQSKIDRQEATPQSIVEAGISFTSFLGKYEPECLAGCILGHCVKAGYWKPFTTQEGKNFQYHDWLPCFTRAGLLTLEDGVYEINDLLIAEFMEQAGKDTKENFWREKQGEVRRRLYEKAAKLNLLD